MPNKIALEPNGSIGDQFRNPNSKVRKSKMNQLLAKNREQQGLTALDVEVHVPVVARRLTHRQQLAPFERFDAQLPDDSSPFVLRIARTWRFFQGAHPFAQTAVAPRANA
jgi:hypothetical protein